MSNEILGLVALVVLFAAIFIGFPIAFTLGAVALATGYYALGPVVFDLAFLQTYSVMKDTVLAAIPFFLCLVVCIALVTVFPSIVTILPDLLMGAEK